MCVYGCLLEFVHVAHFLDRQKSVNGSHNRKEPHLRHPCLWSNLTDKSLSMDPTFATQKLTDKSLSTACSRGLVWMPVDRQKFVKWVLGGSWVWISFDRQKCVKWILPMSNFGCRWGPATEITMSNEKFTVKKNSTWNCVQRSENRLGAHDHSPAQSAVADN